MQLSSKIESGVAILKSKAITGSASLLALVINVEVAKTAANFLTNKNR